MPKGHGNRITKPPSARQRANLKKWVEPIAIQPRDAGLPASSWWLQPRSRADFDQAVAEHAPRMRQARMGRLGQDTHE